MLSNENLDLKLVLQHALKACRLGRNVLLEYFGNLEFIEEKAQAGLVSEADRESERVIFEYLLNHFPRIECLGEEMAFQQGFQLERSLNTSGRWILDPLDGTTNYIHRFPVFCISLALEISGEIQVGVIDVPLMNETYTAIRGKGAFLNGRRIQVSKTENLNKSLLATGFNGEREDILKNQLLLFSELVRSCRGIRRAGAAAYDLCMVAKGTFDGYWESGLSPWDVAAGSLLVEEAGGHVSNFGNTNFNIYDANILAGSPAIHRQLLEKIIR